MKALMSFTWFNSMKYDKLTSIVAEWPMEEASRESSPSLWRNILPKSDFPTHACEL